MRKIIKLEQPVPSLPVKRRVAAYARVSMETERLHHSLSAQVSYYSELIQRNTEWDYVGVYADEGITGTKTGCRKEFLRMLADCESGKIDIILTKSISRFARNTVDLLNTVRHLKELGIEVRFEKENIHSLSGDGEVMLTLLASFAQEEVISLSSNVKWGIRKRFEQGIPRKSNLLGYRWEKGKLIIKEDEAKIVRQIYQNFIDGKSRGDTIREFASKGITTAAGKLWTDSSIHIILTNITYTGNMLLQKKYIDNPITRANKRNHGELPQYFVENTHEAIISMEQFQFVQNEMARRKAVGIKASIKTATCFTGIIRCGTCGKNFARCTNSTGYITWKCRTRRLKNSSCSMKVIPEKVLKQACADVFGIEAFSESVFIEHVKQIIVPEHGVLEFVFNDGSVHRKMWTSTARKDMWTHEFKIRQREWITAHLAKGTGRYSAFTTRLRCEQCGHILRRNIRTLANGKRAYWFCPERCLGHSIQEERIKSQVAETLGLDEFNSEVFINKVEYISVSVGQDMTFHFKEGK